ncbi:hypothetical protein AYO38_01145 [bacterium SCGC AG-212-C10]|nr:hypothetical protein AYO38_01145 [bacterium SCGC AG-212-C10]
MISQFKQRMIAGAIGLLAAVYASLALAGAIVTPNHTFAWTATTGSFGTVSAGSSDQWYNYDFTSQSAAAANVDWPVRFMFDSNAEVDKVKDTFDGCGNDPPIFPCLDGNGGPMNFRGQENGSWYWDQDSGKKLDDECNLDQHIRVYALSSADRNYDPNLGYYVLGTVHKDYEGSGCDDSYYSAEGEQGWWDSRFAGISGWTNHANTSYWSNYESQRWADTNHWIQSDGYTTYTDVP